MEIPVAGAAASISKISAAPISTAPRCQRFATRNAAQWRWHQDGRRCGQRHHGAVTCKAGQDRPDVTHWRQVPFKCDKAGVVIQIVVNDASACTSLDTAAAPFHPRRELRSAGTGKS